MIQRIQTVYMLIAEILTGILFFLPLGELAGKEGNIYRVGMKGIFTEGSSKPELISTNLPMIIFWIVTLILIFATIFLFENRKRQMKFSLINMFLLLTLEGLIFYDVWSGAQQVAGHYSLTIYSVFPVIALIFIYLAYKAIGRDELLVRSVDRIR